ncbi:MAG: hypothetical protein HY268_27165 [Deltaproteobacteria bacterium]|nr:hypothetical protein [Deltaproteobacteria bacterium]
MWPLSQPGLALAFIDFTNTFSPLLIGLLGLVWFSAGFIVFSAIREYRAPKTEFPAKEMLASEDYRDAA